MWLRIYIYGLLQSLFLNQFLWFVYLMHLHFSAAQIGAGEALYQLARLVFDVPSSWMGDRCSKRAIFFAAAVAKALSTLAFLWGGHGFAWIAAGFIAAGLGGALPSGVDLAYLHDVVETAPAAERSSGIRQVHLSRYVAMQTAASLAAGLFGGVLASWSFNVLYVADLAIQVVTMAWVWSLPAGPKTRRRRPRQLAVRAGAQPYLDAIRLLYRTSGEFRATAGLCVIVWALASVQTNYSQGLLHSEGVSTTGISLVFTGASLLAVLGSWLAGHIKTMRSEQLGIVVSAWLYAVSGALRTVGSGGAVIVNSTGIAAGQIGTGLGAVLLNQRLLSNAPSQFRATALSAVNMLQMLLTMAVFTGFGFLATHSNLHVPFAASSGILAVVAVLVTIRSQPVTTE